MQTKYPKNASQSKKTHRSKCPKSLLGIIRKRSDKISKMHILNIHIILTLGLFYFTLILCYNKKKKSDKISESA